MYFEKRLSKQSEYALVSKSGSGQYVLALLTAEQTEYEPSGIISDALLEILLIGWCCEQKIDTKDAVLNFCNRYGFLGFTKTHLFFRDYSRGRFPDWNRSPVTHPTNEFESELKWQTDTFRPRDGKEPDYEIAKKYDCLMYECLDDFERLGQWLLDLFRRIWDGRKIELYMDDMPVIHFENGHPMPVQPIDCLAGALLADFYSVVTEPAPPIKLCKRCGKPFFSSNSRTAYCTASCRNVANVKASRKRRKNKEKPTD